MTFLQLQNAVMTDRFTETQRSQIKDWINARYGRLWASEQWSFKTDVFNVTLPLSATTLDLSTNGIQRVLAVSDGSYGSYNVGMDASRPEDFHKFSSTTSGYPYSFTVFGDNLTFDRPASSARSLRIVGERVFTPLSADGDIPVLPTEFHYMLVSAAASEGLRLQDDPTWKDAEDDFQRSLVDLRASYLTQVRTYGDAYPSWP